MRRTFYRYKGFRITGYYRRENDEKPSTYVWFDRQRNEHWHTSLSAAKLAVSAYLHKLRIELAIERKLKRRKDGKGKK